MRGCALRERERLYEAKSPASAVRVPLKAKSAS